MIQTEEQKLFKRQQYRAWYLKNKAARSAYNCAWDKQNRGKVNARRRAWNAKNPEKNLKHSIAWAKKNPDRARAISADYRNRHPDRIRESERRQLKRPEVRIAKNLRKRLHSFVKMRLGRTDNVFGTTAKGLREWIESKFSPGMTWENYGQWHIDHIRPLASFDLMDDAQIRAASHWSNLQPLWAKDNIRKRDKWIPV